MQQIIALTETQLESLLERAASAGANKALQTIGHTPDVMKKAELAEYWRVSPGTINRYMAIGLPYKKIEQGSPRFYRVECDKWLSINASTKSP